jgi:hypothetical protein
MELLAVQKKKQQEKNEKLWTKKQWEKQQEQQPVQLNRTYYEDGSGRAYYELENGTVISTEFYHNSTLRNICGKMTLYISLQTIHRGHAELKTNI